MRTLFVGNVLLSVVMMTVVTVGCSSEVEFSGGPSQPAPGPQNSDALPEQPGSPDTDQKPAYEPIAKPTPGPSTPVPPKPVPPAPPAVEPKQVTLEREFSPVTVEDISSEYDPEYQVVEQNVTLREQAPTLLSIRQLERANGQESFQQGRDAQRAQPESFSITEAGKLDLLVVMDDSTSMKQEQENLSTKLSPLVSNLENTDWQIAVITTSDPCLRNNRLIKKSDADRDAAFKSAVGDIVLSDTVVEKGFPMAIKALKGECNGETNPWLRDGAAIGVLIVSDEDNCGSHVGEGCRNEQGETAAQMVSFLRSLRSPDQGKIYGLFEGANECGSAAYTATKYKQGVDQTQGAWGSICQSDYTNTLTQISENVRKIVKREFVLQFPPDQGTLVVTVDGNVKTEGYSLNGKVLIVTDLAVTDQTLVVSYFYGSVPKHKIFSLVGTPDPVTIKVSVNDQLVPAGDVIYDAVMNDITFLNEPVDNAIVKVRYKVNSPLPVEFSVAATDIIGAPVSVKVAGQEATNYTYDAASKAVVFESAPGDGQLVDIAFRTAAGRIVRYSAGVPNPAAAHAISAVDRSSGQAVMFTVEGADLVFNADEVVDGRMVMLRYDVGYRPEDLTFNLSFAPLGGAVMVGTTDPTCEKEVVVQGKEVRLDCGRGKAGTVSLKYRAITDIQTMFTIDADIPESAKWNVYVDDVLIPNPARSENAVTLSPDLFAEGSKVKVVVNWQE